MNWFFEVVGDVVQLHARLEDGETLGDAYTEVRAGEDFYGISYDTMKQAESGVIAVDEAGKATLTDED
jgi:hypothetical protein